MGITRNLSSLSFKCKNLQQNTYKQSSKCFTNVNNSVNTNPGMTRDNKVSKYLMDRITLSGPITVADYMKIVLTNPISGYYMHKDVFGSEGDFITSPEISQLFGEMIALWFVNEWSRIGCPKPMQLVELGPGRGTMIADILRVFSKLKIVNEVSCHLVEVSPELSRLQAGTLCPETVINEDPNPAYRSGLSQYGIPVSWYRSLEDIPRCFTCVVAHEFFDALPIHKFQKTDEGWREVLVDIEKNNPHQFRYVISRMPTPNSTVFVKKEESRDHIEICPQAGVIVQHLAQRLEEDGGIALIADYGHCGEKTDTFRAFKKHKLHDPLVNPGSADLTADVDFKFLKDAVSDKLISYGPVTQKEFLLQMHVEKRLEILLNNSNSEDDKRSLRSGFDMMTSTDKMGQCFKFLALYPLVLKDFLTKHPPPGFCNF